MEFEIMFQVVSTYNACGDGDGIIGIGTRSHTCWQSNSWRIILVVVFVIIMYITYGIALKFGKHSTQKKESSASSKAETIYPIKTLKCKIINNDEQINGWTAHKFWFIAKSRIGCKCKMNERKKNARGEFKAQKSDRE